MKSFYLTDAGRVRSHNEDSVTIVKNLSGEHLMIVADGMGGHRAGEIASSTVCEAISTTINTAMKAGENFCENMLLRAIDAAYDLLDERDTATNEAKKMGTTVTFLMLHEEGATIAHMGDSRVYQIRPLKNEDRAEILFQTEDHSLVNDLIKIGELTPEDAKNHPRKNVITRALQPHLEHRYKADIVTLKDIRPNDFFYMCSDGMLEEASNANLCFMLNQQKPEEELIKMLVLNSQHNRDNHSAHLIHILDVENNNRSKRYTWKIKHFLKETYYVVKNTLMK